MGRLDRHIRLFIFGSQTAHARAPSSRLSDREATIPFCDSDLAWSLQILRFDAWRGAVLFIVVRDKLLANDLYSALQHVKVVDVTNVALEALLLTILGCTYFLAAFQTCEKALRFLHYERANVRDCVCEKALFL